jgi:protein gp37
MGANSKIEWTEHTFNPWMGCAKVSTGCKNCYAEGIVKRTGQEIWGVHAGRKMMSDKYWEKPVQWQKAAAKAGRIDRVFCASMADVFERHQDRAVDKELRDARFWLFQLITETPNLMWLLLTKRPENIRPMYLEVYHDAGWHPTPEEFHMPHNVCIMTSVENQEQADKRIPELLKVPAKYRGLSVEPLLGPVELSTWFDCEWNGNYFVEAFTDQLHWVIVGGESGPNARPMHPEWAISLRDQSQNAKVPFFFKQWGKWVHAGDDRFDRKDGKVEWFDMERQKDGFVPMRRVGKKKAGRILDGKEYNQHPFNLKEVK